MNIPVVYMVKVAVCIMAFYLIYALMLSRDTSYGRNRAFILISVAAAMLLPLINFHTGKPLTIQFFGKFLDEVFIVAGSNSGEILNPGSRSATSLELVYSIYIIGVLVFIIRLFIDLINLIFLIIRKKNNGSRIIGFRGFNTSGFSAMGHIFINMNLSAEEADEIIKHENNHLRKNHFLDIIFIEIIKSFQWFNPAIHLFNRSLRAIHEYQADDGCLSSGVPIVNYQSLLLGQIFKTRAFNLTNSFSNPSLIKKRMIMMTKKRTSSLASMKLIFVIPVTAILIMAISAYKEIPDPIGQYIPPVSIQQSSSTELISATTDNKPITIDETKPVLSFPSITVETDSRSDAVLPPAPLPPPPVLTQNNSDESKTAPFVVVEEMPSFPGGDLELLKFIAENTDYPEAAKTQKIQGRVIIRFCVNTDGSVSRVSVLKGVSPDLDIEAIRVVNTLPAFKPGKQGGIPVPVWYMVPITFTLK